MAHEHDTSTVQLISQVITDLRTLMRQEVALARAEIREELAQLFATAAMAVVAAGILGVAGIWILVAVTRGIAVVFGFPLSLVYVGVGIVLAIIGVVLLAVARHRVRRLRVLPETRETLREYTRASSTA
jgi:hypothetical protein